MEQGGTHHAEVGRRLWSGSFALDAAAHPAAGLPPPLSRLPPLPSPRVVLGRSAPGWLRSHSFQYPRLVAPNPKPTAQINAAHDMALHPMAKMAIVAALVTSVLFCEIFACVVSQSGKPALIILPMLMMPVPLLLLRCCGGDDFMSSGPRGRHCACAPSLQANKALSIPSSACTCMRREEYLLFSMLLTSSSLVFRAHVRRRLCRG